MQTHNKEIFLITNNSTRLRSSVIEEKLKKFGGDEFHLPLSHIYTSAYITGQHLSKSEEVKKVYVVGE